MAISEEELFVFSSKDEKLDPGSADVPVFHWKRKGGGEAAMNVDHEVNLLVEEIHRLGSKNADGKLSVKFGVLFRDDKCANLFEALVGTLKAAKRRKIVTYPGELLLQGVHDDVDIILLQD
ncbi:ABRA C-terminal like [Rhinolophus ferrumequinum]|uniref:Costars family protein ABRACL n=1 Tax=Rhinolophus ferrumequinum TaxID=59479 RepID=A0A7J7YR56_RHIFE|nr:ABRA C-terminal like [Rhinolophus ferrumequinum]